MLRTPLTAWWVSVALVASCSSSEAMEGRSGSTGVSLLSTTSLASTPAGSVPLSAHPVGMEWRERDLDLDSVHDIDRRTYDEYQRRVAACMRRAGLRYVQVRFVDERPSYYRSINPLRAETANEFGYHPPTLANAVDPNQHVDGFDLALDGTDDQPGCAPLSFKAVHDLVDPFFREAQAVLDSLDAAVDGFFASTVGQSKLAAWRSCMASAGYDQFESPQDATIHFLDGDIADQERMVRAADLRCDQEVHLTEERSEWERGRFEAWRDSNAVSLSELRDRAREASGALTTLESQDL